MSHRYDMLTTGGTGRGSQKHHPWYKERLKLKFLKTSKHSTALDGAKWRFISHQIDDFRCGVPLKTFNTVTKGKVDPVPIVTVPRERSTSSLTSKTSSTTSGGMIQGNPGFRTLYSREGPRQQMQREHIDSVEYSLLQHPLALYPHLEEAIPHDIADDVIELLDPEINELLSNSESSNGESDEQPPAPETITRSPSPILVQTPIEQQRDRSSIYKFPLIQTEAEKEREINLIASKQVISAKQQSKVQQVTRDLVQWAEQLGGSESCAYIDEQTIKSLFGSNYETKPIIMAPIQVVELTGMLPELESSPHSRNTSANTGTLSASRKKVQKPKGIMSYYGYQRVGSKGTANWPWMNVSMPQVVKSRYGAWYLPVNLWQLRPSDEPLKDPKMDVGETKSEHAVKKMETDEKILNLHGAKAFKEFAVGIGADKRGIMPSFLEPVKLHSPLVIQGRRRLNTFS